MTNLVAGSIDIVPPLAWSEVQPTGYMVMAAGVPVAPDNRLTALVPVEVLVDRPEGTLHRYTFPALTAATPDIPDVQRAAFRDQVAEIIAAFPTHVFGGTSRIIRFRGDALDDQWRVRLDASGNVERQIADLVWNAAPLLVATARPMVAGGIVGRPTSRYPRANEKHCGNQLDHAPHVDGVDWCPGGPYAAPGNTRLV